MSMLLEAIRILTITAIVWTDRGFDVGDVPRLGAEDSQEGGGVHCPCADLGVVGLSDQAAVRCPEFLELEDDALEGVFLGHFYSDLL